LHHAPEEMQLALHTGPHRIVEGWLEATYARGVKRRTAAAALPEAALYEASGRRPRPAW
jgi:cell division inhibitor SulA